MPVILFNKPYGVLTQFTDREGRATLADFIRVSGVYPAGRLDRDSEGLVVLTDDGALQARIADPAHKLPKSYWVQVDGDPGRDAIERLRRGVVLADGRTRPADVTRIDAPAVWPRTPPIRTRKTLPTSWLAITITEGRNRQVRRMTAAVGAPALRLIRVRVGAWEIGDLAPGQWMETTRS